MAALPVDNPTPPAAPPKFSRYRSVRDAARGGTGGNAPATTATTTTSRSRYRGLTNPPVPTLPTTLPPRALEARRVTDPVIPATATSQVPVTTVSPVADKPRHKISNLFGRERAATAATTQSTSTTKSSTTDVAHIEPGGGGIVPGTDAPISAVNAGERRVLVRCKQSSINLPVTPDTTPQDLILSAANVLTQDIKPAQAILLEAYAPLGLERRIRRYEHIRDVMNSWERDTQNALVIQHLPTLTAGTDLDSATAPRMAPDDTSFYLYHSSKRGKWNKRYVTILTTGQIFMAKKQNGRLADKDSTNLCHLSVSDIYLPTPHEIRKSLKPPKKHCYAIRSQQKTSMFISTENYVHYFSIDDEQEMMRWYRAVQAWRSWYLVTQMGEGQKPARTLTMKSTVATKAAVKSASSVQKHRIRVSVDEDPYTLGSFKPLLNMDRFDGKDRNAEDMVDDDDKPLKIPAHLRGDVKSPSTKKYPPITYQAPAQEESAFAPTGLLGRTYSQRQKAQRERDAAAGATLPSATPSVRRTSSVSSQRRGGAANRPVTAGPGTSAASLAPVPADSAGTLPKPLLDFTPQFEEPNPQWSSRGKGRGVTVAQGTCLVDAATGREDPTGLGKTIFRRH